VGGTQRLTKTRGSRAERATRPSKRKRNTRLIRQSWSTVRWIFLPVGPRAARPPRSYVSAPRRPALQKNHSCIRGVPPR
jgi:hypothetical protein